jgi:hypothetical protein
MAARDRGATALALCGPPVEPRHLGRGARLVEADQPFRIEIESPLEPRLAGGFSRRRVAVRRRAPSFLKRDAAAWEETPERAKADTDAARLRLVPKLDERRVWRLGDRANKEGRFGFDTARFAVAAGLQGRPVALLFQPLELAARARRADPKPRRRSVA